MYVLELTIMEKPIVRLIAELHGGKVEAKRNPQTVKEQVGLEQ
jgi:hypothetical protein